MAADPPFPPPNDRSEGLLQHLEGLYAFAQTLTPSATSASHLVEATYRRAFSLPAPEPPADTRTWLFRLMVQVLEAQTGTAPARPDLAAGAVALSPAAEQRTPDALKRRLAEQFLDRTLPTALVSLPETQRRLLILCDVEAFTCVDAASVLGLDAATACMHLERARTALVSALLEDASEGERLLLASLRGDWVQEALQRSVHAELIPLPPTLRPTVTATRPRHDPVPATSTEPAASEEPASASHTAESRLHQFMRRTFVGLLVVFAAGLLGYVLSRSFEPEVDPNLITRSVEQAASLRLTLETSDPGTAERFLRNQLGWRLTLPVINDTQLEGIALPQIAAAVRVPAVRYLDTRTGDPITLFVYNYALLDRNADLLRLEPDVLRQIEDDRNFDLHDLGADKVLIWRNRDDIYLAVTRGDAAALRERIFFPA